MQTQFANGVNPWKPYFHLKINRPLTDPRIAKTLELQHKIIEFCAHRDEFTTLDIVANCGCDAARAYRVLKNMNYIKTDRKIDHAFIWRKP